MSHFGNEQTEARRAAVCLAVCLLTWCVACAARGGRVESGAGREARPPKASMNVDEKDASECLGRFRLVVPGVLGAAGRSQSIYRVDVRTVPLPGGGLDALWRERLARISALRPPPGVASPVIRTFELQPGVSAVWYFGNPDDDDEVRLEAFKPHGDYAVLTFREGMAGKEVTNETLVKNVLDAYVHGTERGFCVGAGAITSEPGLKEYAGLALEHKRVPKFEVTIDTQTVWEPDTWTYSDLDEERQVVTGLGGTIEALRDGARVVAGLEGKEIWASVDVPREPPFVRFTWHFPGVPEDSLRPSIDIKGTAPKSSQPELEAVWETVLRSFRPIPPAQ